MSALHHNDGPHLLPTCSNRNLGLWPTARDSKRVRIAIPRDSAGLLEAATLATFVTGTIPMPIRGISRRVVGLGISCSALLALPTQLPLSLIGL